MTAALPRIVFGMSSADYHAHPAVSKSQLDELRTPAHFKARYIDRTVTRVETPAMKLGTALHTAVLEPERFERDYVVSPKFDRRTTAGKEGFAKFQLSSMGLTIIDEDERDAVLGMAAGIASNRATSRACEFATVREASFFWIDEETGVECRCRPDGIAPDYSIAIDVKTTRDDAGPFEFSKTTHGYAYHKQAAFYSDGIAAATGRRPDAFVFVAVEKEPPFLAAAYQLDEQALDIGRRLYRRDLRLIAECRASKSWPGYPETIQTISLPAWATRGE